jgi:NADPH:quinone reductase-like Zn-dependent oxidoreductase
VVALGQHIQGGNKPQLVSQTFTIFHYLSFNAVQAAKAAMSQTVIRIDGPRTSVRKLKAFQEDIPVPTKHEVLIKVHSVSLNYRDIGVATSGYPFPVKENVVPCSDAAGVVVEVGEGEEPL